MARRLRYSPPCAEGSGSVETEVCPMARPGGAPPSRRPPGAQPPPPPRLQPGDGDRDRDRDGDRGRAARRRAGGGWSRSGGGGGVPAAAPHAAGARLRAGRRLRRRAHRGPRPRHRLGPAGALPEAGPAAPGQPALRRGKKGHWDQPRGKAWGKEASCSTRAKGTKFLVFVSVFLLLDNLSPAVGLILEQTGNCWPMEEKKKRKTHMKTIPNA